MIFLATTSKTSSAIDALSLWDLIVSGGWVMVPLALISVAALAVIFYYFRYVNLKRLLPQEQVDYVLLMIEKGELDKARGWCHKEDHIVASITKAGLSKTEKGSWAVEEAIAYEGKEQIEKLWVGLNYLGDMAVIAPMLGLLGTVLGMIDAFDYQAFKAGSIQPVSLAQGLSKAMITTAFGLIIAVPILGFYGYFRKVLSDISSKSERFASELNQLLNTKSRS